MARGGGTRALSEAPREGYAQGGGRVAHLGSRAAIADIAAEPLPGNRQQKGIIMKRRIGDSMRRSNLEPSCLKYE
jgi:hypothetical protein